jgi:chromosome transmission fidelity protein 18
MRLTLLGILWAHETLCSDARSGQVVDERIRPAIESGYAVGSARPVLVVIDEIDGATGDNVSHEYPPNRGIC